MQGPTGNPYASNRHGDVLNEEPADDTGKLRLVEEIKNRAKGAFAQKDMPSAELLYGKAITLLESTTVPGKAEPTMYSNRAMVRLNLNKVDGALSDSKKCIELDPKSVKAYHRKALALQRLNEWEDAIAAAQEGAKLEPDNKAFPELIKKCQEDIEKDKDDKAKLKRDAQDVKVELHNASTARAPPKTQKMDVDEDNSMKGYKKTADGKTTSYFHTEITEEAKALIAAQGFGKPQKLEAPAEDVDAKGGGSQWNQAGTYEEKGMLKWIEQEFRSKLVGITFAVPAGAGGSIVVKAVESVKGDASISVSRGKRRYLLDLSFDVEFEGNVADKQGSGKLKIAEVSTGDDDQPEVGFEINAGSAPELKEVFTAFVKNAGQGLQPLVIQEIKGVIENYKKQ
jgi:activator of HSP90 ATPase